MAPARRVGGSTFGDSLPKPCPSCPLALMKGRAVSLLPAWDAGREQGLDEASRGESVCLLPGHLDPALLPREIPRGAHLIPADVGRG